MAKTSLSSHGTSYLASDPVRSLRSRCGSKAGRQIRIQEQPFRLLLSLIENADKLSSGRNSGGSFWAKPRLNLKRR